MKRRIDRNYKFFSHYTYYVPGAGDIVLLLVWLLVGALAGGLLSGVIVGVLASATGMPRESLMEYAMLVAYPVQFIPAMIYASAKSRSASFTQTGAALDSRHFAPKGGLLLSLALVAAVLFTTIVLEPVSKLLPSMPDALKELFESMTGGNFLINFICVSIFAPLFEEWLCRGMVLRGLLVRKVRPVWAIVISALFFALIHLNPWQALPAFAVGCLMGYVYYRTGSLRLTMLMHFVNNTFALVVTRIPALEDVEYFKDFLPTRAFWLLFICGVIIIALTVRMFAAIDMEKKSGNIDTVPALFTE